MSKEPPFGSDEWKEWVFSNPPARALKGRSKPTQYHQIWSNAAAGLVGAQGRNEAIALLALEYLHTLGQIRRIKEQPFKTPAETFGSEIVPDYLAELQSDGSLVVVEVKTDRFLTRIKDAELELYASKFADLNIKYYVWTDKQPLSRHVRVNLMAMRRASAIVSHDEQHALSKLLTSAPSRSVSTILSAGYDLDCIFATAWRGLIHFDLTKDLNPTAVISHQFARSNTALFLGGKPSGNLWWNSLQKIVGGGNDIACL
jgi:hypothetical protein